MVTPRVMEPINIIVIWVSGREAELIVSPSLLSLQPMFPYVCYFMWVPRQLFEGWEGLQGVGREKIVGNILLHPTCPIDKLQEMVAMWSEYTFVGDLARGLFKIAVVKVSLTWFYLAFFGGWGE